MNSPLSPAAIAPRPFPGSALLHPLVLGAVIVLLVNDHLLKARWPSWWTGKLSDLAGLAMFPLLRQALWEHVRERGARTFRPSRAVLVSCVLLTAACFSAIKVSELAGAGWQWGLGLLQWPASLIPFLAMEAFTSFLQALKWSPLGSHGGSPYSRLETIRPSS